MTAWVAILAVGAGSYLLRVVPVLFDGCFLRSPRVERTIGHAGTAALTALVVSGLGHEATSAPNLVAVVAAAIMGLTIAARSGSMLRVLFAGGAAYGTVLVVATLVG